MGLKKSDFPEVETPLWEENWEPLKLFLDVSTQWIQGPGGPSGLNYQVVFHELDRRGVTGEHYDELMAAIRVIEQEALKQIYKK